MPHDNFEELAKDAIERRYHEKYGEVQIRFDLFQPLDASSATVHFTLSSSRGFITRYYGTATYQDGDLQMSVQSI